MNPLIYSLDNVEEQTITKIKGIQRLISSIKFATKAVHPV
ncbi:hypothetical protein LCGC14_0964040 [marine sediment metagenome]|uniref:Uncharacterized protein n=1 Tax=marine sediment metagenome TaxID=412755 RepID=A0A0F9NDQ4_9ZZZZ